MRRLLANTALQQFVLELLPMIVASGVPPSSSRTFIKILKSSLRHPRRAHPIESSRNLLASRTVSDGRSSYFRLTANSAKFRAIVVTIQTSWSASLLSWLKCCMHDSQNGP